MELRGRRLIDRKETLEALMKDAPKNLYHSKHVRGNGKESFAAACEAGMEGIVGKKADSIYSGTRNGDWIKLKCDKRQRQVLNHIQKGRAETWRRNIPIHAKPGDVYSTVANLF